MFILRHRLLKRVIAGISAVTLSVSIIPFNALIVSAESLESSTFNSDTVGVLKWMYETTALPQIAISEGITAEVKDKDGNLQLNLTTLPDWGNVFAGSTVLGSEANKTNNGYQFWLDVASEFPTYSDYTAGVTSIKSYMMNSLGSCEDSLKNYESRVHVGDFLGSDGRPTDPNWLNTPSVSDSGVTLYDLYVKYASLMSEADKKLMACDLNAMAAQVTKAYDIVKADGAVDNAMANSDRALFSNYISGLSRTSCKKSDIVKGIYSTSSDNGIRRQLSGLQALQSYLDTTGVTTETSTVEDYVNYLNGLETLDGAQLRTEHSKGFIGALAYMIDYSLNNTNDDAYDALIAEVGFCKDNAKEVFELLELYEQANAVMIQLVSKWDTLKNDCLYKPEYAKSIFICTRWGDFRRVAMDANNYVPISRDTFDTIVATVNNNSGSNLTGGLHETTPFFEVTNVNGSYKAKGSPYCYDVVRGAFNNNSAGYNYNLGFDSTAVEIMAANSNGASPLARDLADFGLDSAIFKRSNTGFKIYLQPTGTSADPIVYDDSNEEYGYKDVKDCGMSLDKINWASSLYYKGSDGKRSGLIANYLNEWNATIETTVVNSGLSTYLGYLYAGSDATKHIDTIVADVTSNGERQKAHLTGDAKFLVEINHFYDAVSAVEEDEEELPTDEFKEGVIEGQEVSGSFVAYIPEYSLAEYYTGIAEIPAAQQLKSELSNVDPKSRDAFVKNVLDVVSRDSDNGGRANKPSVLALNVKLEPVWATAMSKVTTNKKYTNGWISDPQKFRAYDLNEYTGSHDIDVNSNFTYRVVNGNAQFNEGGSDTADMKTAMAVDASTVTGALQDSSHLYAVMAQAYGSMNGSGATTTNPYYKAIQRLLYPIEQWTNDGTGAQDLNAQTTVKGKSRDGNPDFQVYVTNSTVPDLTWNFTKDGSIVNLKAPDNKKNKTFALDYHMWVSRTSEKDGVYIADWVNESPVLLQGLIAPAASSTTKTSVYQNTSDEADVPNEVSYEVENYDITLASSKVSADFSDWSISKEFKSTTLLWCDEWKMLVPQADLQDHMWLYYDVDGEGVKWVPDEQEFEETFTYTWTAPSWQSDVTLYDRTGGTHQITEPWLATTLEPSDIDDSDGAVDIAGNRNSPYGVCDDAERNGLDTSDLSLDFLRNKNKLFYDWYFKLGTGGAGAGTSGDVTSLGGQKFNWDWGWRCPTGTQYQATAQWFRKALLDAGAISEGEKSGTYIDNANLKDLMTSEGLHVSTGYWKEAMSNTKVFNQVQYGDETINGIFFCIELYVTIPWEVPDIMTVEKGGGVPTKTSACDPQTSSVTDYKTDAWGNTYPIHVHDIYTSCNTKYDISPEENKEGEDKLVLTEEDLEYTSEGEDSGSGAADLTGGSSESGGSGDNVMTIYNTTEEEIEYHSKEQIQVCEDEHDEVLVYFTMKTGFAFENGNYEKPEVKLVSGHEGSSENHLKDVIGAKAMYDDGNGGEIDVDAARNNAIGDHPESRIQKAAESLRDSVQLEEGKCQCIPQTCMNEGYTHSGTSCTGCSHPVDSTPEEDTHFYSRENASDYENEFATSADATKGRDFSRWAIIEVATGTELTTEEQIKEVVLKHTCPPEWETFNNPDKVSGLLRVKGKAEFKKVPTFHEKFQSAAGGIILWNTDYGVVDGKNDEHLKTDGVKTGEVGYDTYQYNPVLARKVITKTESHVFPEGDAGKFVFDEYVRLTANVDNKDIFGDTLKDKTWQADRAYADDEYWNNLVPEVLMTYKTGAYGDSIQKFPTPGQPFTEEHANNAGIIGSTYVSSYNMYKMQMPMYSKIVLDADGTYADTISSQEAVSAAAKKFDSTNKVFYTGSEINTTTYLRSSDGAATPATVEFKSYVLDFADTNGNMKQSAQTLRERWGYSGTAMGQANNWLNLFKSADNANAFTARATTYITFSLNGEYAKIDPITPTGGKKHTVLSGAEVVEFGNNTNTKYTNVLDEWTVTVRNGRISTVANNNPASASYGHSYNLYGDGSYNTTEALKAAMKSTGSSGAGAADMYHRDNEIAEAIINMRLAEFAATLSNDKSDRSGTETWTQYRNEAQFKRNGNHGSETVLDEVNKVKDANGQSGYNGDNTNWYGEDSIVLAIKVFSTGAVDLPEQVIATSKIPIDYGFPAPANKQDLFKSTNIKVYAYAEFSLELNGDADVKAAKAKDELKSTTSNADYSYASWDLIGDELTGFYNGDEHGNKPTVQFVMGDASVNDMY